MKLIQSIPRETDDVTSDFDNIVANAKDCGILFILLLVLSKCYERKILGYVVVVMFTCLILGKYPAANVKKGYSQVGNELLHEAGSSWIV